MEHAEDSIVIAHILKDSKIAYQHEEQPPSVIRDNFFTRFPPRLEKLDIPDFRDASRTFCTEMANILPGFLNEKHRRRRLSSQVVHAVR